MYPEAYSFSIQKAASKFGREARADEFDLVITPLLENGKFVMDIVLRIHLFGFNVLLSNFSSENNNY